MPTVAGGPNCQDATKATSAALEIRLRVGRLWPEGNAKRRQGIWMRAVNDAVNGEAVEVVLLGHIG